MITDPDSGGVSGVHIADVFQRLGIAEQVKPKLKLNRGGPNAAFVARGEAEMAIQLAHEIRAVPGIEFIPLPVEFQRTFVFSAGLASNAKDSDAAKALILLFSLVAGGQIQVAQDRRLAEDRRCAQSARGGCGMMTIRAALAAVLALGILLLVAPFTSETQQSEKIYHVGYLSASLAPPECRTEARDEAFLKGLRDLGYVREKNIIIERRCYMTGDEIRKILSEFIRLKVDVIFVAAPEVALAAKNATKDIPIVCGSCGDPVDNGLVVSLARPGGNVTGLASLSAELIGKRVELLKEAVPGLSRVAVLVFPSNPGFRLTLRALEATGRALGIEMQRVEVRNVRNLEKAFRSAAAGGAGAVLVQDDPLAFAARTQIADLALKHRLPLVAGQPQNAEAGALMAYGPERIDLFRRAAGFVDRILKGAKPADLPVEQPTKFELVINLKTAKALGLTIPPSVLMRADEIIQ